MQHYLTPFDTKIETFAWWENAFTNGELDYLQALAADAKNPAIVGGGDDQGRIDPSVRRSNVTWLEKDQSSGWLFDKLSRIVSSLNAAHFRFSLTGFGEPIQLTNYNADDQGCYGWHQDFGATVCRKLSLVLQLTDPSQYDGGNLELLTRGEPDVMRKQRGLITLFPSWTLHQVTPVTRGSRQSLVAWISGEPFR